MTRAPALAAVLLLACALASRAAAGERAGDSPSGGGIAILRAPVACGKGEISHAAASLRGNTGHVEIPRADVTPEGSFRLGVGWLGAERSDIGSPEQGNTLYYLTLGFFRAIEISIRATAFHETGVVVSGEQSVVDRAVCGRFQILAEGRWPALSIGADDVKGNRRAHALYAVSTKSWRRGSGSLALTGGFGSRAIEASSYVIDGPFGGAELGIYDSAYFLLENDSKKWNAGVRLEVFHLAAQAAVLGLDTLAGGVAWTRCF